MRPTGLLPRRPETRRLYAAERAYGDTPSNLATVVQRVACIRDQHAKPSCVGQALAACIDALDPRAEHTRCSAVEAAEHGVRINAVAPSIAMHAFLAKVTTDDLLAELSSREAFGRPAEVWEVANVMMFLASDLSSYMTGEVVSVSSQRA